MISYEIIEQIVVENVQICPGHIQLFRIHLEIIFDFGNITEIMPLSVWHIALLTLYIDI